MTSRSVEVQRMYPRKADAISFCISIGNDKRYYLDTPFVRGSCFDPNEGNGIIFTHFHQDHCPHRLEKKIKPQVFIHPHTVIMLEHIGFNCHMLNTKSSLKSFDWNTIEGLGKLYPIPVSHSSIDAHAFFLI
ncbi:MAG: hypothetical protein N3A54_03685, partial [Patescibacteria group bacterium]|nr:hypothetical protein [Patescibacteria group bacterium]